MKYLLLVLITVLFVSGCQFNRPIGQLQTIESVPENEAIVIGRLRVFHNESEITSKTSLIFNHRIKGTDSVTVIPYRPDTSGFIFMTLPIGESFLRNIYTENLRNSYEGTLRFRSYYRPYQMNIVIKDKSKIYYIGDITIRFSQHYWERSITTFLLGGMTNVETTVTIDSLPQKAITEFEKRFQTQASYDISPIHYVPDSSVQKEKKPVVIRDSLIIVASKAEAWAAMLQTIKAKGYNAFRKDDIKGEVETEEEQFMANELERIAQFSKDASSTYSRAVIAVTLRLTSLSDGRTCIKMSLKLQGIRDQYGITDKFLSNGKMEQEWFEQIERFLKK